MIAFQDTKSQSSILLMSSTASSTFPLDSLGWRSFSGFLIVFVLEQPPYALESGSMVIRQQEIP